MLEERIAQVRRVLEEESASWGAVPRLIAVTKYSSVDEIMPLLSLGVTDIGENRVQSICEKLPSIHEKFSIHMIGRLQTNKVKYIIRDVAFIQSLDRMALAQEIDRQAQRIGRRMPVLVQVNIGKEPQKGGIAEEEVLPFLKRCAGLPGLHVQGLMAMMPQGADRDTLSMLFGRMRTLYEHCVTEAIQHTDICQLSMGMSQDYDLAARAGATMVRIGSALFR